MTTNKGAPPFQPYMVFSACGTCKESKTRLFAAWRSCDRGKKGRRCGVEGRQLFVQVSRAVDHGGRHLVWALFSAVFADN
ncbi:hypothetical protein BaRGS_00039074 [Batillaria attramentaria]|uniref:Uncharacterized protein n=1 Tax=Batillaria attramentaria TaxID=370345 RepID=A0ABD0J438_9CAEN